MSTEIATPVYAPPGMPTTTSLPGGSPQTKSRKLPPHRKFAKKFLTLPDELLSTISDAIDPEDLPNFRLTCKTLNDVSGKTFGEKRLAHRRFIFTEFSMQGLVDLTAHPVFGPCVKEIMFGTHRVTNNLHTLLNRIEKSGITDNDKAMEVLRLFDENWTRRSDFEIRRLEPMLSKALCNLQKWGSGVILGVFDDIQLDPQRKAAYLVRAYGLALEYVGLPFRSMVVSENTALQVIRNVCRNVNFQPKSVDLYLHGEEIDPENEEALSPFILDNGQLRPEIDACLEDTFTHIGIVSSQRRLDFRQGTRFGESPSRGENRNVSLHSFAKPMRDAILSAPYRHLRIESCAVKINELIHILRAYAGTLRVVELIGVYLWVVDKYDAGRCINRVLQCLKDDVQLERLVLDNVRAMHIDYYDGVLVAKGRSWHGQQRIQRTLAVLIGYGMDGWDGSVEDEGDDKEVWNWSDEDGDYSKDETVPWDEIENGDWDEVRGENEFTIDGWHSARLAEWVGNRRARIAMARAEA
ncbi:hypothetical protein D6D01_05261 [Aureobasidium pullulans]|uniref:F-box domain-containing protein n=1 Tax=Aureobasidium pullulans TaxID=5580 RepID=A0A4S9L8B2_AURPU|nr:hypothetical protein D6D01_05261 [Aureobasidium pullulans]